MSYNANARSGSPGAGVGVYTIVKNRNTKFRECHTKIHERVVLSKSVVY